MAWYDFILGGDSRQLDRIEKKQDALISMVMVLSQKEEEHFMADTSALDALTAQVTENTDLEQSAILLIQGLADQIANAGTDPAALAALSAKLKSSADALAAAITANTPAPPAP
jgi:hypothetical protein